MNVATLWFDRIRQRPATNGTSKISGGTSMLMSSFIFTWQASRIPSRASRGVICATSVGR